MFDASHYLCSMLLNRIVAGCMLLVVMLQSFSNIVFVTEYYINTAAFAENCINKNKPLLNCNGHCQLEKKMGEESGKTRSLPERKVNFNLEVLSAKSFFSMLPELSIKSISKEYPLFNTALTRGISSPVFHPPCS